MSYYEMDHVEHVRAAYKQEPSDFGQRVATIIGCVFGGLYNTDGAEDVDYTSERFTQLTTRSGGEIASWDFNRMSELVFFAHDLCIRISIGAHSKGKLNIFFHDRKRDGGMASRHPTIEQALEGHRALWPSEKVKK